MQACPLSAPIHNHIHEACLQIAIVAASMLVLPLHIACCWRWSYHGVFVIEGEPPSQTVPIAFKVQMCMLTTLHHHLSLRSSSIYKAVGSACTVLFAVLEQIISSDLAAAAWQSICYTDVMLATSCSSKQSKRPHQPGAAACAASRHVYRGGIAQTTASMLPASSGDADASG